jgi:lipid-A-disaccharide synthase
MRVLMVAGEASGDAHAAAVARRLRAAGAEIVAVGGPALAAAGAEILAGIDALAVLGFAEVVSRLPRILAVKRAIEQRLAREHFDLFLPVDYPGFNLRVARSARRRGVPVLYYVGPQVWAWRAGRLRTVARVTNHVALILPFEKPLYDAAGIPATFVGHPLLDDAVPADLVPDRDLGLFPGSRAQEIERHLPVLLATARRLHTSRGELRLLVSQAPTAPRQRMEEMLRSQGFDPGKHLVSEPARIAMRRCRALLVASGTATLEAALAERPFAVLYRTGKISYRIAAKLVHVPHVALANLVAGEAVVREYLQEAATPDRLAEEVRRLLDDETERQRILQGLQRIRSRLGTAGAAERVAALAQGLCSGEAVRS